jgi:hypothetical protein
MYKAAAFFLTLLLCFPILVFAQNVNEPDIEFEWDDFPVELYVRGDQTFLISLGVVLPTIFLNNGTPLDHQITPPVGGMGSLAYNYYLNSMFFLGGEVGISFLPTLAGNTVFLIPLGLRGGTQFIFGRFEFPITLAFGMSWHNYLNFVYYGMYAKLGGAAYFRVTNDWSFGISANWGWFPQWTSNPSQNVDANIMDISLSARYHF